MYVTVYKSNSKTILKNKVSIECFDIEKVG